MLGCFPHFHQLSLSSTRNMETLQRRPCPSCPCAFTVTAVPPRPPRCQGRAAGTAAHLQKWSCSQPSFPDETASVPGAAGACCPSAKRQRKAPVAEPLGVRLTGGGGAHLPTPRLSLERRVRRSGGEGPPTPTSHPRPQLQETGGWGGPGIDSVQASDPRGPPTFKYSSRTGKRSQPVSLENQRDRVGEKPSAAGPRWKHVCT